MASSSLCTGISLLLLAYSIQPAQCSQPNEWLEYKTRFGKQYQDPKEDAMRRDIFYKSKHELDTINKNRSIILELDQMDDWTRDELAKSFGVLTTTKLNRKSVCQSLKPASRYGSIRNILKMGSPAPDSFDWRRVPGSVSRAKDQGPCGNSWAFATTGLLEGQLLQYNYNALPNGQAISLSEQFLIDCSGANCVGMYPWDAIDVLIKTGGIPPEDKYAPYKGYLGQCKPNRRDLVLGDYLVGYDTICNEQLNDEDIKKLVYNYGPVVIGIHGNKNFAKHVPAIAARDIIDIDCNDVTEGNYAALIVGWGQDAKRGQFWIIKTSLGEKKWGQGGYGRLRRNHPNCSMIDTVTIAMFKRRFDRAPSVLS